MVFKFSVNPAGNTVIQHDYVGLNSLDLSQQDHNYSLFFLLDIFRMKWSRWFISDFKDGIIVFSVKLKVSTLIRNNRKVIMPNV